MEMSQGNSLCSYLKQTKMYFFFLLQNWRTGRQEQVQFGGWNQWEDDDVGKEFGRVNMAKILCTHVCKWKNDTC
jgi:hypothetical protein